MTARERFLCVLNFNTPEDRLPLIEWAAWWDQTIRRWEAEGLPAGLVFDESLRYFGLDNLTCIGASCRSPRCPQEPTHSAGILTDTESYEEVRPFLFPETSIGELKTQAQQLKERHDRGEIIIRLWLDGFFWFPRALFGIQDHLFAFYDHPELMHRMNGELAEFHLRTIKELLPILTPDMVGFAEDMSYNNGPMLSQACFNEFLLPYYHKVIPTLKKYGMKVMVDSDGDITTMIPWLLEAGIEGVYPLERQAGVDIGEIRRRYPDFLMLGGYDKMVMPLGEAAMRAEFERLLPAMQSGGYIPAVDHQTPPGVSLDNYRIYIRLFVEYAEKAVMESDSVARCRHG